MTNWVKWLVTGASVAMLGGCEVQAGSGSAREPAPRTTGGEASETEVVVENTGEEPPEGATTAPAAASPVECAGQEEVELDGTAIDNVSGPAVKASGQCRVRVSNCELQGTPFGVVASGNAEVTLTDCRVGGSEGAISASGNAVVQTPGTELAGAVETNGNAEVGPDASPGRGKAKGKGKGKGQRKGPPRGRGRGR